MKSLNKVKVILAPHEVRGLEELCITDFDFYLTKVILYAQIVSKSKILLIDLKWILVPQESAASDFKAPIFDIEFADSQFGTLHPYPNSQIDSDSIKFNFSSPSQPDVMI